jgi:hypothetical protein
LEQHQPGDLYDLYTTDLRKRWPVRPQRHHHLAARMRQSGGLQPHNLPHSSRLPKLNPEAQVKLFRRP